MRQHAMECGKYADRSSNPTGASILDCLWLGNVRILVSALGAVRELIRLPQWRVKMSAWDSHHRALDVMKHLLWIALSILVLAVIGPALMDRGLSWKWCVAFLPEVAIVVATLVLDDAIQVVLKVWMMARI